MQSLDEFKQNCSQSGNFTGIETAGLRIFGINLKVTPRYILKVARQYIKTNRELSGLKTIAVESTVANRSERA